MALLHPCTYVLQPTVLLLGLCSQTRSCQPFATQLLYDLIYHLLSVPPGTSSFSESVIKKTLQNTSTKSKEVQLSSELVALIIIMFFCEWGNIKFFLLLIHSFSCIICGQTRSTCMVQCKYQSTCSSFYSLCNFLLL